MLDRKRQIWPPDFECYDKQAARTLFESVRKDQLKNRVKDSQEPVYGADEVYWPTDFINRPGEWNELALDNIAVFDSGCDPKHAALAGRVDFADEISKRDLLGHGTFVAGCIAAKFSENLEGKIADGLLSSSRIWMANVLTKEVKTGNEKKYHVDPKRYQTFLEKLIAAKSAKRKSRLSKIQVLSLSLGASTPDPEERRLIAAVIKSGITVVAAAGNNPLGFESEQSVMYPAAYPDVISVGAMAVPRSSKPTRWPRSLRIPPPESYRESGVDIYAPGECVLSSWPTGIDYTVKFSGWCSGTSMATPFVAAAVAVLRAQGVSSRAEILARLAESSPSIDGVPTLRWEK